jgi:hypothetical protein
MPGPSIAVLLGGKKPEEDSSPSMDAGDDMEDMSPEDKVKHQVASAEGLIKAVSSGSPTGVIKAFKALMNLCEGDEDEEAPAPESSRPS